MLDPWLRRRIIEDRSVGIPYNEICKKYHVKRCQVHWVVSSSGLGRKIVNQEDDQNIRLLALSGLNTVDISEQLNLSLGQVRRSLKKQGLNKRRGRPCQAKQAK